LALLPAVVRVAVPSSRAKQGSRNTRAVCTEGLIGWGIAVLKEILKKCYIIT
jgi:hypothetical protein